MPQKDFGNNGGTQNDFDSCGKTVIADMKERNGRDSNEEAR